MNLSLSLSLSLTIVYKALFLKDSNNYITYPEVFHLPKKKKKHNSLLTYIVTSELCYALEEYRLNGIFFFSNLYLDLHIDTVMISFI